MGTAIVAGLIGLLGVLVGGVINGYVQAQLARSEEKRLDDLRRRGDERELRVGRRVVANDFFHGAMQLAVMGHQGTTPYRAHKDAFLPVGTWQTHHNVLAAQCTDPEWAELTRFASRLERIRGRLEDEQPGLPLSDDDRQDFFAEAGRAVGMLRDLGLDEDKVGALTAVLEAPFGSIRLDLQP